MSHSWQAMCHMIPIFKDASLGPPLSRKCSKLFFPLWSFTPEHGIMDWVALPFRGIPRLLIPNRYSTISSHRAWGCALGFKIIYVEYYWLSCCEMPNVLVGKKERKKDPHHNTNDRKNRKLQHKQNNLFNNGIMFYCGWSVKVV